MGLYLGSRIGCKSIGVGRRANSFFIFLKLFVTVICLIGTELEKNFKKIVYCIGGMDEQKG